MEEIYKTLIEFNNYEISTFGNVRNIKTGRILKGQIDSNGYNIIDIYINNKRYRFKIHRLIAIAFIENPENKPYVDHIDNNPLNNQISNLRWATNKENQQNSKLSKINESGVKGVSFHKSRNKWMAHIKIDGTEIHLGYYLTLEEAKQARINKANAVFGLFTNACEKL